MSEEKKDGGLAFSTLEIREGVISHFGGLTKREWFAGMALKGILANPATAANSSVFKKDGWMQPDLLADCCYEQADAMIRQGEKQ